MILKPKNRAIVIPAFNEENTIAHVVSSLLSYGTVIVVNDASKDKTPIFAEAAGAVVVNHIVNQGYESAINSGFNKAVELSCKYVITFDADGQHDASIVNSFFSLLENNSADVVLGIRPVPARISEKILSVYTQYFYKITDPLCGMKAYRIDYYKKNNCFDRLNSIGIDLTLSAKKQGARIAEIKVPIFPRQDKPRFGSLLKSNIKILMALFRVFYFYEVKQLT